MSNTYHQQVPFFPGHGVETHVDEGLIDVLNALREFDVDTRFSCQGGEFEGELAYILAYRRSAMPLIRRILWFYITHRYNKELRRFIKCFVKGSVRFELSIHRRSPQYIRRKFSCKTEGSWFPDHVMEFSYSRAHGDRLSVRWPPEEIDMMFKLLVETHILNQKGC